MNASTDLIRLQKQPLDPLFCLDAVADDAAGGSVLFVGKVRRETVGQAQKTAFLDFEAYEPMAVLELKKIADEAQRLFSTKKMAFHHRLGRVPVGEAAVVIAVAAAHRAGAFEACRWALEKLKTDVPIFKKEIFADGSASWVEGHLAAKK